MIASVRRMEYSTDNTYRNSLAQYAMKRTTQSPPSGDHCAAKPWRRDALAKMVQAMHIPPHLIRNDQVALPATLS